MTTLSPSAASRLAIDRPIPRDDPVMSATRFNVAFGSGFVEAEKDSRDSNRVRTAVGGLF